MHCASKASGIKACRFEGRWMAKAIASSGLGKGEMGKVPGTQDNLDLFKPSELREFFNSPTFFG